MLFRTSLPLPTLPLRVIRRTACLSVAALLLCVAATAAEVAVDSENAAWRALKDDAVVLFRHANAPGVGDPPGLRLDDCSTQRNLDADGRAQALRIGRAFVRREVPVGAVWSSAWCRAKETAELAFPGRLRVQPAFNSFFDNPAQRSAQTASARRLLLDWRGPGALVVVTHQVNIGLLTAATLGSGEGVVLRRDGDRLEEVGRIAP